MSAIFEVYNDFSDNLKVASHYELMQDFPTLTPFTQYTTAYQNYYLQIGTQFNIDQNGNVVSLFFPPLRMESAEDYTRRLSSLSPNNIYKSVVNSVIGLMGRKNPSFENVEDHEKEFTINLNGQGDSLFSIIKNKVFPSIMSGLVGILVDYVGDKVVWSVYDARNISKKHLIKETVQGVEYIKRSVIVTEEVIEDKEKPFTYKSRKKALLLMLIDKKDVRDFEAGKQVDIASSTDPSDFVAVYRNIVESSNSSNPYDIVDSGVFRSKSNQTFDTIPFYLIGADENADVPFYSACKKSFKKANIESLFEEAIQISNYPMIYTKSDRAGLPKSLVQNESGEEEEKISISPQALIELGQQDDIGFLEWGGACFQITDEYMQKLDHQVTSMIINKQSNQQTQKTKAEFQGQQTTDTSLMVVLVNNCQKIIQNALTASTFYLGKETSKTPIISLSTDFVKEIADGSLMTSILNCYNDGLISGDLAIKTFQKKEIIDEDTNFQIQQEKIQEEQVYSGTTPNDEE